MGANPTFEAKPELWDFGYEMTDETNCLNGYTLKIRAKHN